MSPLWVGCALWLRLRAFANASTNPPFAYPRYLDETRDRHPEHFEIRPIDPVPAYPRSAIAIRIAKMRLRYANHLKRVHNRPPQLANFWFFHLAGLSKTPILAQFSTVQTVQ